MEVTKEELEKMSLDELSSLHKMLGGVIASKQELAEKPKFKRRKGCLWLVAGDEEIHLQI